MKEPWQWLEKDVKTLIIEQRKEDLRLEYKRADALAKNEKNKEEIAKDVSAMANSAGGVIVYGIDEQKKSNGPIRIDGIDSREFSVEWLEQVIDSRIQRRIDGVKVNSVTIAETGKLVYLVWVPQSLRAPHMASDHRYYKRLGTTTALMEEYEVRDVARRQESADLHLDIKVRQTIGPDRVLLEPYVMNSSPEPAFYATCRLYLEGEGSDLNPNRQWSRTDDDDLIWNGFTVRFRVARCSWSVPERHPILEGETYPLGSLEATVIADARSGLSTCAYRFGWNYAPQNVAEASRF